MPNEPGDCGFQPNWEKDAERLAGALRDISWGSSDMAIKIMACNAVAAHEAAAKQTAHEIGSCKLSEGRPPDPVHHSGAGTADATQPETGAALGISVEPELIQDGARVLLLFDTREDADLFAGAGGLKFYRDQIATLSAALADHEARLTESRAAETAARRDERAQCVARLSALRSTGKARGKTVTEALSMAIAAIKALHDLAD